ncbi:MAG: transcription elongation factor GreA [Anaerolineales bacterium]|nr:transcription elongation factor GreA [Chloroflexota bacterium]MBL6981318.1 transcription elongation factor GreA [Anaerolineales bacterium]
MPPTYLTQEGFEKLQQELEYLRTTRRHEVAERLREALEDGDSGVDADAECDAARNEQAFVEGRIQELKLILANAQLIDEDRKRDEIQIGSKVTIQEDDFDPESYTIVGAVEAHPSNGRISNESPLGKALIGHKAKEDVTVQAPNGSFTVKILKVE